MWHGLLKIIEIKHLDKNGNIIWSDKNLKNILHNQGEGYILDATFVNQSIIPSSYYFGLEWSGYTNIDAAVNCEDTFYQFEFNKVYTVAGLIDEFKNGGRGRFIGIKEIDSQDCESTINKFPVNEGFRNFDLIYFLFAIILQVLQIVGTILLIVYHLIAWLWDKIANLLN